MGLFLQARHAFLHSSRLMLSRESVKLRVTTADVLLLDDVWAHRRDGAAIQLPLEKVEVVVDTQLTLEPRPTSQQAFGVATLWQRVRAGLGAAARELMRLVRGVT